MDGVQGAGEQPQTFTGCTGRSTGTRSIISQAGSDGGIAAPRGNRGHGQQGWDRRHHLERRGRGQGVSLCPSGTRGAKFGAPVLVLGASPPCPAVAFGWAVLGLSTRADTHSQGVL